MVVPVDMAVGEGLMDIEAVEEEAVESVIIAERLVIWLEIAMEDDVAEEEGMVVISAVDLVTLRENV